MRARLELIVPIVAAVALAVSVAAHTSSAAPANSQKLADTAQKVFDDSMARYKVGQGTIDEVVQWSERVYEADHSSSAFANRAGAVDREAQSKVAAGLATKHDLLVSAYHLAEADARR